MSRPDGCTYPDCESCRLLDCEYDALEAADYAEQRERDKAVHDTPGKRKIAAYQKAYREANREKLRENARQRYRKKKRERMMGVERSRANESDRCEKKNR